MIIKYTWYHSGVQQYRILRTCTISRAIIRPHDWVGEKACCYRRRCIFIELPSINFSAKSHKAPHAEFVVSGMWWCAATGGVSPRVHCSQPNFTRPRVAVWNSGKWHHGLRLEHYLLDTGGWALNERCCQAQLQKCSHFYTVSVVSAVSKLSTNHSFYDIISTDYSSDSKKSWSRQNHGLNTQNVHWWTYLRYVAVHDHQMGGTVKMKTFQFHFWLHF